ncbi:unnamed protein product [Plutella xylostella]|uniref:(diamondback moth) hypothetical protein n=1 Tax=Plutella xylostella TaxID=51655 RepID=A0A8S4GAC9_PLUXY|nr:unnamed protein product [Plutella xylostella]
MDKKNKKKTVIKRKSDEAAESEKRQKIMVNRAKVEEEKDKVEVVGQVVEVPAEQSQQVVHTGQLVEGNFEQPVFVNMKGEPVQLGPNTVILYEQSGNPSNFAFGGMWTMDSSGRIVMAETIYDVKGEPEEEGSTFVQNTAEVSNQQVEEQSSTFQQYEITNNTQTVEQPQYEVAIIDSQPTEEVERTDSSVIVTEAQLAAAGAGAVRWLNQKYDFVVRKLQLNYGRSILSKKTNLT